MGVGKRGELLRSLLPNDLSTNRYKRQGLDAGCIVLGFKKIKCANFEL